MGKLEPCSALRGDRCFNGFWVTAVCHGISAENIAPTCCNEARCAHLYGDRGWPLAEREKSNG